MSDLNQAIASVDQSFMDTYGRGDAQGMAQLYTGDGQLLPGGSEVISFVTATLLVLAVAVVGWALGKGAMNAA